MSTPFESLHIMTPDTTRALNNSNKNLYDTCVKREYNFKELSQNLQYSGTVENFGSEVLLEARKLNEKYILPESFFSKDVVVASINEFFEPMWSPLTPTTEQCPIVQCVLKDIFLDNHTYELYIEDAELVCFPRSDSTSDPEVHKSFFYICKYKGESIYDNILFKDTNESTHFAEAFVLYNRSAETNRMMGILVNDYTRDRIDVTPDGGKTKVSISFTEHDADLPWLWYYSKYESEDYTHIELSGDTTDEDGHDLINFGTDGHGNMFGYFLLYGMNNVPSGMYGAHTWYIRCYATEPFDDGEDNYKKKIQTIVLGYGNDVFHLDHRYTINVDNCDDVKMLLDNGVDWNFHAPEEGEDVYDTDKRMYAYVMLSMFEDNIDDDAVLKPTFRFSSKIEYENPYSTRYIANINSKNGIHLDTSDDGSDYGIPTKNGSIHSLGDFDGIPEYFHTHLDESIHRIHAEVYTIHEDVAQWKPVTERPTAALLFDSAIPHNESDADTSGLEINIKYDYTPGRQFSSIAPPIDPSNALSEIVYIDPYNFGTSVEAKYAMNPKFVYHGHRVFSLTKSGLDPENEIGRVYYLSNDPAHYVNNTYDDKAPRTMARICDIPTSFLQLVQIDGISPGILCEIPDYVRSECAYSKSDKNNIWNEIHPMFVSNGNKYVPSYVADVSLMPTVMEIDFNSTLINDKYAHYTQLFGNLDLKETFDYSVIPSTGGTGYAPGDIIAIQIGGVKVEFEVFAAPNGEVSVVLIKDRDSYPVLDKSLFKTRITTYSVENISSSGEGCVLELTINENKWNQFTPIKGNAFGIDIYGLCRDPYENLWVLRYDTALDSWEVMSQLTGVPYVQNLYDENSIDAHGVTISRRDRSVTNVFMYNLMNERNDTSLMMILYKIYSIPDEWFDEDTLNIQDMTYLPETPSSTGIVNYAGKSIGDGSNITLLPRFHQLNLDIVRNHTRIHINADGDKHQVLPFMYNPFKTFKDQYAEGRYTKNGDLMLSEYYSDFINENGVLQHDVYEYNLYKKNTYYTTYRDSLEILPRENLISLLEEEFPESILLNDIEEYSTEYIIDYIMMNSYPRPLYLRNDREIIRHRNDVVERNGKPVGEQQTGWFEYLTDYHNPHVTVDTSPFRSNQFNIFKLEDTTITSIDPLRIYDEYGNDISSSSLILFGNNMYYFNTNRWVNIHEVS